VNGGRRIDHWAMPMRMWMTEVTAMPGRSAAPVMGHPMS
jgi:hypothetical protein